MSEHDESPIRPDWEAKGREYWAHIMKQVEEGNPPNGPQLYGGLVLYGVPRLSEAATYIGHRLIGREKAKPGNPGYSRDYPDDDEVREHYREKLAELQEAKQNGTLGVQKAPHELARELTARHYHISPATVRNKVYRK